MSLFSTVQSRAGQPRRPTVNNSRTRDVVERGSAALQQRRQAAGYGRTDRDMALDYLSSGGALPSGPNPLVEQWQAGMAAAIPADYQILVGQGDGKYAGFETEGQLKSAVLGYAENARMRDRQVADQYRSQANEYLSALEEMYGSNRRDALRTLTEAPDITQDSAGGGYGGAGMAYGMAQQDVADNDPYVRYLDRWYNEQQDPYIQALEAAQTIEGADLRDYAAIAGAQYNVDPYVVAGWYPEESRLDDFQVQRDLESLDQYGVPFDEFQSYVDDRAAFEDEMSQEQQDAYQAALSETVAGLGFDPDWIQQETDMTLEQVVGAYQDAGFQRLNAGIMEVAQNGNATPDDIGAAVEAAYQQALGYSPQVARLIGALWADYPTPAG